MTLNDGWIEWKWSPEKTYPETLETEVFARYRDGIESNVQKVLLWHSISPEASNWFNTLSLSDDNSYYDRIISYKLATPSETS